MSTTKFDLLVADVAMPDIDGYELVARVRQGNDHNRAIPSVAVTAYAHREDRDRALAAGFDGYCPKPLDEGEFISVIASLLTARSGDLHQRS